MPSFASLAYILAATLRELFPKSVIHRIESTEKCFYCDLTFPGEFTRAMIPLLEERMHGWVKSKILFDTWEMVARNAVQFLEHHGEKQLAYAIGKSDDPVIRLIQLDRFFFKTKDLLAEKMATNDVSLFRLVDVTRHRWGLRILGIGGGSKEEVKQRFQQMKGIENLQKRLEKFEMVSWMGDQLIWEKKALVAMDLLKEKIKELYHLFDLVFIPLQSHIKGKLSQWVSQKRKSGFQFQMDRYSPISEEEWDTPFASRDLSWGKIEEINSFLHIMTKFLKISSLSYEVISRGKMDANLQAGLITYHMESLKKEPLSGKPPRLEFRAADQLGRKWLTSWIEWDRKEGLVEMSVCCSFERVLVLMAELMDSEALLDRLKLIEK